MIKKTLYFGNPAYLSLRNDQLVIHLPGANGMDDASGMNTIPIEDIGLVVLDHRQITVTQGLLERLLDNTAAVVTCDSSRMPAGLLLPLEGHTVQQERFRAQIDSSVPLRKQLWQQTVRAKISNQAALLRERGIPHKNMLFWASAVRSDDPDNLEARAAAYFWSKLFPQVADFRRDREGVPPNNLLNYGYAILRAVVARSLVCSGLLPTLGIHHHNRYNAFALADDVMEPYRPFVDRLVCTIMDDGEDFSELNSSVKSRLLTIPTLDVAIDGKRNPLMVAVGQTTASLAKCYIGTARKIDYPKPTESY